MGLITLVLQFVCQFGVGLFYRSRVGRGRLLSRPLARYRPFSPMTLFGPIWSLLRLKQLLLLILLWAPARFTGLIPPWTTEAFNLAVAALYLDDYLTGDDERWKRFKELKNKVKWRRFRAAPALSSPRAGC